MTTNDWGLLVTALLFTTILLGELSRRYRRDMRTIQKGTRQ